MVGRGVCRRAYWQAHVQCSDARDLSAPLTLQRGDHSATQAQSLDSSPFLCHVVESSHPSLLGGILALKNEYIVAWASGKAEALSCGARRAFGSSLFARRVS